MDSLRSLGYSGEGVHEGLVLVSGVRADLFDSPFLYRDLFDDQEQMRKHDL